MITACKYVFNTYPPKDQEVRKVGKTLLDYFEEIINEKSQGIL